MLRQGLAELGKLVTHYARTSKANYYDIEQSSREKGVSGTPDPIDSLSAFFTNFLDLSRSI